MPRTPDFHTVVAALLRFFRSVVRYMRIAAVYLGKTIRSGLTMLRPAADQEASDTRRVYRTRRIVVGVALLIVVAVVVWAVFGLFSGAAQSSQAASPNAQSQQTQQSQQKQKSQKSKKATQQSESDGQTQQTQKTNKTRYTPLTDAQKTEMASKAEQTAQQSGKPQVNVTYCIRVDDPNSNKQEFEDGVFSTLNNPKGWARAGVTFTQEPDSQSNTCDMTIVLAPASQMTSYSEGCSEEYSCRVGNNVIINTDRWNGGTQSWLGAGGTLPRYRDMVINHEVGHRLGHIDNETQCAGPGNPAPLMQQQSMGMKGCTTNEWPLDSELWVNLEQ